MPTDTPLRSLALPMLVLFAACGRSGDQAATDSAGATTAAARPAPATDTGMAGMRHDSGGNMAMNAAAPKDSNQAFLRMMVDHHEGLIAMAMGSQGKLQGGEAKTDAQKLMDKQRSEQQQMKTMLAGTYSDQHMAMVMPSNRAMNDSLQATQPGPQFDKDFYHHVIAHHREGVRMTDRMLPHLTGDVKAMAEKMKADHQREIQEFEREGGAGGPKG